MEPNNPREIFDATVDNEQIEKQPINTESQLAEAKIRAEHQNKITATVIQDIISQKKKSFRKVVVLSISSVVILLLLSIVFFIYFHWYGIGAGVAVVAFVVAQVWLNFFKKWGYNQQNDADFGDNDFGDGNIDNQQSQPKGQHYTK